MATILDLFSSTTKYDGAAQLWNTEVVSHNFTAMLITQENAEPPLLLDVVTSRYQEFANLNSSVGLTTTAETTIEFGVNQYHPWHSTIVLPRQAVVPT